MTVGTATGRAGARRPRCLTTALLLSSLLALPEAAHAQTSVSGTVSDLQGLPLPGGTVLLRSETGQFVASAVTNREGRFAFPDIAEGTYVVEATLLGFATSETSVVTGSGAPVAVTLEVGAFAQEVTVSALMPELATELVATVSEIERRVTQDLAQSLRSHAGVTALRRGAHQPRSVGARPLRRADRGLRRRHPDVRGRSGEDGLRVEPAISAPTRCSRSAWCAAPTR